MPDVLHTFRTGHKIMVQVQCSWFPLVDRNPQTFMDIAKATPPDFHSASQRVYWGSSIQVGVLLEKP
jgi:predicted acyl esterase